MKILWISQNLPYPPKTGVLQRNYNLIREASRFAEVHLIAILKKDILPIFDRDTAEVELRKLCARVTVTELPTETSRARLSWVLFKSIFTRLPFTVNWAESEALRIAVSEAISTGDFDLVYFDTISLAAYRGLVGHSARVLNHHNIESRLFERRLAFERNPVKYLYLLLEAHKLARYEASVAGTFDANLTVSELDAQRLKHICPSARVKVVPNGVDVEYFMSRTSETEPGHMIMVSGMNWFPNRDAALFMARDVWPLLSATLPQIRLTIVGTSPPPFILDLASRDRRITVTGFANDVRPYIERAQIYVCPMRDGGGTRLKILDALAMCRPIVATTMALEGIPVIPERDVLVANTPQEFVHQIKRIMDDPALGPRLALNGRVFVESNFSWDVVGKSMRSDFESIVQLRRKCA